MRSEGPSQERAETSASSLATEEHEAITQASGPRQSGQSGQSGQSWTQTVAAHAEEPRRIVLSSEVRERFAAQLGLPTPLRSGPEERTLTEQSAHHAGVSACAALLATAPSRRELHKTLREIQKIQAPEISSTSARAPSADARNGAQPPGKLTEFWDNLSEQVDPAHEAERAVSLKHLGALRKEWLLAAAESGQLRFRTLQRDETIALSEHVLFVHSGQLALGLFSEQAQAREQEFQHLKRARGYEGPEEAFQRGLRLGPLAHAAALNLATLGEGDVVGPREPLRRLQATLPQEQPLILYAVTQAVVCAVARSSIADWCRLDAAFQQALDAAVQAAVGSSRGGELADRYLRHGGSLAQTLRVVDPERCMHCRECERACEERHGRARLRIGGPSLGGLSLVDTCQSCADPRCVTACGFDALRYDAEKREIVLNEDKCVGCSYCEKACPYGAIDLVDLAGSPRFVAKMSERIHRAKAARPEGSPEEERHPLFANRRRVASKCDHCAGFSDQACISACSKDALFEIRPASLFFRAEPVPGRRPPLRPLADLASAERLKLPELATRRPEPTESGPGRALWMGAALLLAGFYGAALLQRGRISHSAGLGLWAGVLGWLLILLAWGFAACNRIPRLREAAARASAWSPLRLLSQCDLHAVAGLTGPLLIFLHARFVPNTRDAFAFFGFLFMWGAALSGLLLRYYPRWLQRRIGQAQLAAERLHDQLTTEVPSVEEQRAARATALGHRDRLRARYQPPGFVGKERWFSLGIALLALGHYATGAAAALGVARQLRARLARPHVSREAVRWTRAVLTAQHAQLVLPPALLLMRTARYLHITSAVSLLLVALLHVLRSARALW